MNRQQICTRCVIDATVPGVAFDENGVCNHCALYDRLEEDWPLGRVGRRRLEALVDKMKQEGKDSKYDCIVGFSGGTDSSYTLYLTKKLGLRPLAVDFDNGWSSDTALNNMHGATSSLNIDLRTYEADPREFDDLLKAYLWASFPWADTPSDKAITATLYRAAEEEGIKYIIVGRNFRTEGKMPAEWSYSDDRTLQHIHQEFGEESIDTVPRMSLLDLIRYQFVEQIEYVLLLNYVEYSKSTAREILRTELDWRYYGGHHYENIYTRFVYSFLLPQKFGIDKRKITHSALIRNGDMTRDEALADLQEAPLAPEQVERDIDYVIEKLGLTRAEFDEILALPPKSFRDYASYFRLFETLAPIIARLPKGLMSWTPPFIREIQMRRQAA